MRITPSEVFSFKKFSAYRGTKLLIQNPGRINLKFFVAMFAFFYHISSKIKAAFGGLKEVVRPLHLLTAKFLDTKIPQLSSNISVTQPKGLSICL
jgi:hypothetical protein